MTAQVRRDRLGGGAMFDRIARRYDWMNRVLSLGLDRSWRRRLLDALAPLAPGEQVLDVASGTADVALAIARRYREVEVVGLDPSDGMLEVGRRKAMKGKLDGRVRLVVGDAQDLPWANDSFAASCIAFGIRNVPDRLAGLAEMNRVTRPGGPVCVLELSIPRGGPLGPIARFHVRHIVPRLGGLLAGDREYRYLAKSIEAFPTPDRFAALMEEAGIRQVRIDRQSFGSAHLYVGRASG